MEKVEPELVPGGKDMIHRRLGARRGKDVPSGKVA